MKIVQTELVKLKSVSFNNHQIYHNTVTTWKLCLTPNGLRINTNILNISDLYQILLNGIRQLEINNKASTSITGLSDSNITNTLLWKPKQQFHTIASQINEKELQLLVHSYYQPCFLPYQIVDQQSFLQQYNNPQSPQELLLVNSIHAWIYKHASIYHYGLSSNPAAAGEIYFLEAKQFLRRCFTKSNHITIHALLNLYMYQLSCERTTLAYLYIGLAIRMAQNLGFHKKHHMPIDLKQREINKRLWWSVYWLDLCAALESNRPTIVDDKDCDMEYPTRLEDEDEETGYHIAFSVQSIKLMKIRKVITKHLPSEQKSGFCLLDALSNLESSLAQWLQDLPFCFSFSENNATMRVASFCDEARLILNIQYHTTWIMLHKLFLREQEAAASPVTLLSLDVCTRSANLITQLLQIYAKQLHWCHFYYCLDSVVESVYIHQKSVMCNYMDTTTIQTAFKNLTITISILYKSPLIYMQKVRNIIDQVKEFLNQQGQQIIPQKPLEKEQQEEICQSTTIVTTGAIILRNPNINLIDFIQPTFSNDELNQILSIYND
ncbi:hypothetical protein INT46_000763 [Mucor plumbeus]|uniref:Xylanolytic transcriptional activator regulatory domain-containing protein n=1 Tax=Mucor plumbeus TaxID=97098 RepID=A0A8H7QHA3_9FUNG|nr:hypothetical protein INT46_000763 [Mucor plumbeus]